MENIVASATPRGTAWCQLTLPLRYHPCLHLLHNVLPTFFPALPAPPPPTPWPQPPLTQKNLCNIEPCRRVRMHCVGQGYGAEQSAYFGEGHGVNCHPHSGVIPVFTSCRMSSFRAASCESCSCTGWLPELTDGLSGIKALALELLRVGGVQLSPSSSFSRARAFGASSFTTALPTKASRLGKDTHHAKGHGICFNRVGKVIFLFLVSPPSYP
jgi:hypothetical protein